MVDIISIIVLGLLVLAQAVERYFFAREMNQRVSEAVKAVMSRNINEFIAATADRPKTQEFTQNDEVSLDEATEEEFDKYIKQSTPANAV